MIGALAGGIADVISHERDGLLVSFGDVEELANAIERLVEDEELAHRLGLAGYKKTLALHTWEHKYSLIKDAYETLESTR